MYVCLFYLHKTYIVYHVSCRFYVGFSSIHTYFILLSITLLAMIICVF